MSYARRGAEIEDTEGSSTITRLHLDWPSGFSDLSCGHRPPRRPSRVMVEPVAGLMDIDLVVTPFGHVGCARVCIATALVPGVPSGGMLAVKGAGK